MCTVDCMSITPQSRHLKERLPKILLGVNEKPHFKKHRIINRLSHKCPHPLLTAWPTPQRARIDPLVIWRERRILE